jgi:hypothetical protein
LIPLKRARPAADSSRIAAYYPHGSGVFLCDDCSRYSLKEDWVVDDFGTYFWYEQCPCCAKLRLCSAVYSGASSCVRLFDEPERYQRNSLVPLERDEDRVGHVVLFRPRDPARGG